MENKAIQKKPPRGTGAAKVNKSLRPGIDDILSREHVKLEKELEKIRSLRGRTGFSPAPPMETSSASSDIDEFFSSTQTFQITPTKEAFPSWKSHTSKLIFQDSSSEELLLSTYEDSVISSNCTSPTYIRTSTKTQSPHLFITKHVERITNNSSPSNENSSTRDLLITRLSSKSRKKISQKEIREINKRFYQKLPEVQDRQAREKRDLEKKIHAMYIKGLQYQLQQKVKQKVLKKK